MAFKKEYLMIPGPTPIPQESSQVMGSQMFNHRGEKFAKLQEEVVAKAKYVFQTSNDLFILTASGTGAMEASLVNFLSPGDKIICLVNGNFGERMAQIADAYELQVERMEREWGEEFDYQQLADRLRQDKNGEIKAITMVHNESSTGMMNDLPALAKARGNHPALLIIDTVSSMGAVDLPLDELGVDVCFTGSQKVMMSPPGVSLISVSPRAWKAAEQASMPRFYLDLQKAKSFQGKGQTPFTPAIPQILSLRETLNILIEEEGLVNVYSRHKRMAEATRAAMRAMGLELLVADKAASRTVTAVRKPDQVEIADLRKEMRLRYGVVIAGGQGKLADKIFRFGHMGAVQELDVISALAALEMSLRRLGFDVRPGSGVGEAEKLLLNS